MLIDTHCHLNDPLFAESFFDVIARAEASGVGSFIVPAYDSESLERTKELAALMPGVVYPAYGVHPWFIDGNVDYDRILSFLKNGNAVAVGEVGLDFSPQCPPQNAQVDALERQLTLACDLELPLLIHCRKAFETLYAILEQCRGKVKGVIHSFSGSQEMMTRFLNLGFYVSFSGSVTRRTAKRYHRNGKAVPLDRFLLETDAPSIATETTVASEVEPRHTVEVAQKMAELKDVSFEEICEASTRNAKQLFRLA